MAEHELELYLCKRLGGRNPSLQCCPYRSNGYIVCQVTGAEYIPDIHSILSDLRVSCGYRIVPDQGPTFIFYASDLQKRRGWSAGESVALVCAFVLLCLLISAGWVPWM